MSGLSLGGDGHYQACHCAGDRREERVPVLVSAIIVQGPRLSLLDIGYERVCGVGFPKLSSLDECTAKLRSAWRVLGRTGKVSKIRSYYETAWNTKLPK